MVTIRLLFFAAMPLLVSACALFGQNHGNLTPFTTQVDASVQPPVAGIDDGQGGSRPVAAVQMTRE